MNRERLKRLAKFLEKVPAEQFDMNYWGKVENGDLGKGKRLCLKRNLCGTSACALGWATQIPSFKAAGLKLVITEVVSGVNENEEEIFENFAEVRFGKYQYSMQAAREFFEIGQLESHYLFNPSAYDDENNIEPADVVTRINELVNNGIIDSEMAEHVTNELNSWSNG